MLWEQFSLEIYFIVPELHSDIGRHACVFIALSIAALLSQARPFILCQSQENEDQQQERRFSSTQFDSSPFSTHGYPPCATTSAEKVLCRQKHADAIQTQSHVAFSLCPGQDSPHSSNSQERSVSSTRPSVIPGWEKGSAAEKGILFLA